MRSRRAGRGRAGVLAVVGLLGAASAGCGGSGVVGMSGPIRDPIAERAASDLGVAVDRIEVGPGRSLAGSACVLRPAGDREAIDAQPAHYVELPDRTVVGGRAPGVAEAVLDACFGPALDGVASSTTPPAAAVAQVVVTLTTTPGPIELLTAGWARRRLAAAGFDDEPPTLVIDDAGGGEAYVVTFLTQDTESETIGRATVSRTGGGPLLVHIEEL